MTEDEEHWKGLSVRGGMVTTHSHMTPRYISDEGDAKFVHEQIALKHAEKLLEKIKIVPATPVADTTPKRTRDA